MNKTSIVKTSNNKTIEYKQQGNVAFQLLVQAQQLNEKVDLFDLMRYPLTPVPYSISTSDGVLLKSDKAKGLNYLTKELTPPELPPSNETLVVEDGNALFHCMKEVPKTFKEICGKLLDVIFSKSTVVFSTDMYVKNSIKSMERKCRGAEEKLIIKGWNTKRPTNWKEFLTNDENKQQFIKIINDTWISDLFAYKLIDRNVIMICEGQANAISTVDGKKTVLKEIPELYSTLEETDSRVILYCLYAKENLYKYVRIRTPDSDIFFICLNYAKNFLSGIHVIIDTGSGNKRRLINVTDFASKMTQSLCSSLMSLHAFTRCDTTSAFKGIGKIRPIKLLQKNEKYEACFLELGESWVVSDDLFIAFEEFTCAMYGRPHEKSVNQLRTNLLKEKCGRTKLDPNLNFHMGGLPPCRDVLEQHVRRVNYQVAIWKHSHIQKPQIPLPTDGHGWHIVNDDLEPLWTAGSIMPPKLADLLTSTVEMVQTESEEIDPVQFEDDEFDLDELEVLAEEEI